MDTSTSEVTGTTMTTLGFANRYNPIYQKEYPGYLPGHYPNNVLWLCTQRLAVGDGTFSALGGTWSGGNLIVGTGDLAIGNGAGNSLMVGRNNKIVINGSTQSSIVMGENSTSGYGNDYMIGYGLASNNNIVGITYTGKYNKDVPSGGAHVFVVGAGTSNTDRKNAIEVLTDNTINIGIISGTTTFSGQVIIPAVPIVSLTGATLIDATYAGKIIEADGTFTITLPDGMITGMKLDIVNVGSGTITIAASTTLQSDGTKLETQYTGASVYHRGNNIWAAFGRLTV